MKTVILCAAFLVLGVTMGWYFEHSRGKEERASIVEQVLGADESSDSMHVARAIRAIGLIESGNTQGAIESLSKPIADYYAQYRNYGDENQRRAKLRGLIEDLSRTNRIVARVIKDRMETSIP